MESNIITVVIERADNNFSAYVREVDGITATGCTIDRIKTSVMEAVDEYVSACKELGLDVPTGVDRTVQNCL